MRSSINKWCPFRKRQCSENCGLFDASAYKGCVFLTIADSLEYTNEELLRLRGKTEELISIAKQKSDDDWPG